MAVEGQMDKERTGDAEDELLNAHAAESEAAGAGTQNIDESTEAAFERVKQQLEDERRQRLSAEAARREAEDNASRFKQEAQRGQVSVHQANLTAVSRALEGTQTLIASLKAEYRAAMANQDWDAVADIQEKMSDAAARKLQLENGKVQLEAQASRPPQQEHQPANDFEAQLARYTPRTQGWLRNHPDILRDQKLTYRALAAHNNALAEGHVTDSDAYFDALDQAMGFKPAPQSQSASRRQMAAPPSRSMTPGSRQTQKLDARDMSPKMLQLAKESDMKPEDWLAAYNEALAAGEISPIN